MFSGKEKFKRDSLKERIVDEVKGEDFTVKYLQEHIFVKIVLVNDKDVGE